MPSMKAWRARSAIPDGFSRVLRTHHRALSATLSSRVPPLRMKLSSLSERDLYGEYTYEYLAQPDLGIHGRRPRLIPESQCSHLKTITLWM